MFDVVASVAGCWWFKKQRPSQCPGPCSRVVPGMSEIHISKALERNSFRIRGTTRMKAQPTVGACDQRQAAHVILAQSHHGRRRFHGPWAFWTSLDTWLGHKALPGIPTIIDGLMKLYIWRYGILINGSINVAILPLEGP